MENEEESTSGVRVTRSVRKRLGSVDNETAGSRAGSPVVSKLIAITESSDTLQKPARNTRQNFTTSAISTPNKGTRSAALRAQTPDLIGSPARKSTRKRSVSISEEESSYAATATIKSAAVNGKQQQFEVLLEEAMESNENSKSEKSADRLKNKQRKPGPKSRTKKLDDANFDSDKVKVEVVNSENEHDHALSNNKSDIIVLDDESLVEYSEKEENIVEPKHIIGTEDTIGATNTEETVNKNAESIPDNLTVLTTDTPTVNNSSKDISTKDSKQDPINKFAEMIFEGSEATRDASETQTSPLPKSRSPEVAVIKIEKPDNLTPTKMLKLKCSSYNSPLKNKNESANTKSVAFNSSDSDNVVKSTFPKTPGLTKSKSYIDMDSSKETAADQSYQSDKGLVASFKDAQANVDELFIPETQEVEQDQQHQSSKELGLEFFDETDADDVYDINPLIQRLVAEDVYDGNPLSENTPQKASKLLTNLQSSTPLLDAATKQLNKPEAQEKLLVSVNLIRLTKIPDGSPKVFKSNEVETNEVDEIETTRANDVSSTVTEKSIITEVVQEVQDSSATSPFAKSWAQSISSKAGGNISQKIDTIMPDNSFNAKTTGNSITKKAESRPEQPEKAVSKGNSRYASEDDEGDEETVPANDKSDEHDEDISEQDGEFEDFIVEDKKDYRRKEEPYKKFDFFNDEAMEVDNYHSGDSMDDDERFETEENEIIEDGLSLGSRDTYEDDLEEVVADSFIASDTEEAPQLEYSNDDEHLESDNAKEEKAVDKLKKKKIFKRIQTLSSDSDCDAEVMEIIKSMENDLDKSQQNKDDVSQDVELKHIIASVVSENSKELNSAKSEKKNKYKNEMRKSSLQSVETIDLNSSSICRKSLNKSRTVATTEEIVNAATQQRIRSSTSSAFVRPSLRRSDAAVVESNDIDDLQNKSLKSIRQHSRTGEKVAVQVAEDNSDKLKKRVSLNESRSERKLKSALNESKLKENSDKKQGNDKMTETRKVVTENVSKMNDSKRESHSQIRPKDSRMSMPNDSQLNGSDKYENSKVKKDKVVEEKNDTEIRKPKRVSLNQSRLKEPRKSLPSESKLNISKTEQANNEKEFDGDDEREETSKFEASKSMRKSLNSSHKAISSDGKVKEKKDKSHRASLQRSVAVSKERSFSSSAARDDGSNGECTSEHSVNGARHKEKHRNLYTETKLADPDAAQSSSNPELKNKHEASEDVNEQRAKFSSEDEQQLEKLTMIYKPAARLEGAAEYANSNTKSKDQFMKSHTVFVKEDNGERYGNHVDARKGEVHREKLKRKRSSKSFGDVMATLNNTLADDVSTKEPNLKKKFKFAKAELDKKSSYIEKSPNEIVDEAIDKVKSAGKLFKKKQSAGMSPSLSEIQDAGRVISLFDKMFEEANLTKLASKRNCKKNLVRLPKKLRERPNPMYNEEQNLEEEMDVEIELDDEEEEEEKEKFVQNTEQKKEKKKLALTKAFKASVAILTAPPLGMKKKMKNKNIHEEKRAENGHSHSKLEVSSDEDEEEMQPSPPLVPRRKRKPESRNHNEKGKENLTHGNHHHRKHQLKSDRDNHVSVEKNKSRKKTHTRKVELSTGTVLVGRATPAKITTSSANNGFRESPLAPRRVVEEFKVHQKHASHCQDAPLSSSSSAQRKRKRPIEDHRDSSRYERQWSPSGVFREQKLKVVARQTKNDEGETIKARPLKVKQVPTFRDDISRERAREVNKRKHRANWHE